MRGEYHFVQKCKIWMVGSPPLARGIHNFLKAICRKGGITPACAGNTNVIRCHQRPAWDHPRLRGEYFINIATVINNKGSPPLARGIPDFYINNISNWGITPACAGNTQQRDSTIVLLRDHPRLRGEYYDSLPELASFQGSPPLARGIRSKGIQLSSC